MMDNNCKICNSADFRDHLNFKDKKVVVCKDCDTFRTFPYPDADYSEHEFYCEHYIKNEELYRGFARDMAAIAQRYKNKGRLLDIGCSVGFVLDESRKMGFEAQGLELNKKAIDIARSRGFDVECCDLSNAGYPENHFDVVMLNHILEHIVEPNIFLQEIKRIFKREGILVIGVPNHGSLVAGIYRTRWYGWGLPEHIWHFDKNSLRYLLSRNGFTIKEFLQNSQYYPFSKSLRKNTRAVIAGIGNAIGAGDQLIAVTGVKL